MIVGTLYLDPDYQKVLIPEVLRTNNVFERMRGLLGRPPLGPGQAMLITRCSSIHTFFMTYPLDLVFLDQNLRVKKLVQSLEPWRAAWSAGSSMVLEMQAGNMDNKSLEAGQTLYWKEKHYS